MSCIILHMKKCKDSKPIRNTILNFNELVSDLDIETSFPDS